MIHQYKVELQEIKKKKKIKRERDNNHFISREKMRENNNKFIENNMRRKNKLKVNNVVINTKLSQSCYFM